MRELLIGYARVSTDAQDPTDALDRLGVPAERIYVDHGLTGTNRDRAGLRTALSCAAKVTRSSSPSSTDSLGHCRTHERSSTTSPSAKYRRCR